MEAAIAAIISAFITGIVGPLLTVLISRKSKEARLPAASEDRIKKLRGKWYGVFIQDIKGAKMRFEGIIFFKNNGKVILGEAEYEGIQGKTRLSVYNGIFDGSILKIEYKNEVGHVVQYGTAITKMNARGDFCEGGFIGFSPGQEDIATGQIYFSTNPIENHESVPIRKFEKAD